MYRFSEREGESRIHFQVGFFLFVFLNSSLAKTLLYRKKERTPASLLLTSLFML